MILKKVNHDSNDFFEVRQVLKSKWLKIHIRNRIHILKLSSLIMEEDVIQQVAMYLFEAQISGKKIKHPIAWSKLVSERHIQKVYKKNKLNEATKYEAIEDLLGKHQDENYFDDDGRIRKSIEQLKPANREIIKMRYFRDLSWGKIAEILSQQEGKQISEPTARKRGERALNELRQIYFNKLTN